MTLDDLEAEIETERRRLIALTKSREITVTLYLGRIEFMEFHKALRCASEIKNFDRMDNDPLKWRNIQVAEACYRNFRRVGYEIKP